MQTTTNYNLKTYEGTDYFNPLTVENPNAVDIDAIMKSISDQAVGTATELATGTVHALTRSDSDQVMFRFTATSNFAVGDTFTVDGVQVSALSINGQALPDEAYLAGAEVLCALVGTRLTVYGVTGVTVADDSLKLGGRLPSYYGTAADVTLAQNTATAAGNYASALDTRVTALEQGSPSDSIDVTANGVKTYNTLLAELFALLDPSKITQHATVVITTTTGSRSIYNLAVYDSTAYKFSQALAGPSNDAYNSYLSVASLPFYYRAEITSVTTTVNVGAQIPPVGTNIKLIYR